MKTIKTSDLTGAALDWAVAKCEGRKPSSYGGVVRATAHPDSSDSPPMFGPELNYSTDWAQGGPIIEREHMHSEYSGIWRYFSTRDGVSYMGTGPTSLIAAMRCYVASKLGDTVEVPDELT